MVPVTIYTRNGCPYCTAALGLLNKKGAKFT
ncbi:MAG: glutaredoxin family protein, partial [Rhizobiaceae bacterium]